MVRSTLSPRTKQAERIPTDPAELLEHSREMLTKLARRCAFKIRVDGGGHGNADEDELLNVGFVALLEARGRYASSKSRARYTTYAHSVAAIAMWRYALACHYGLSLEQHHRMTSRGCKAPWHYSAEFVAQPVADEEERPSRRRVRQLLLFLSFKERERVEAYLEEGGNYSAVARRLGKDKGTIIKWFHKLIGRLRQQFACVA